MIDWRGLRYRIKCVLEDWLDLFVLVIKGLFVSAIMSAPIVVALYFLVTRFLMG